MHPYKSVPNQGFWSKAVARGFDPIELLVTDKPLISKNQKVMSAGSCFAANLVPFLEREGYTYLRTEYTHPLYTDVPNENFSYDKFSAGYGNVYTARQLLQLLLRCLGKFKPVEEFWAEDDSIIDVFRPGLRYPARSVAEFNLLNKQHLEATLTAFRTCDVFIFTLGLTEAWMSVRDGSVFSACPGTIAGTFDPFVHAFVNFDVSEVTEDLSAFIQKLAEINPTARMILTVSPVPLVATATRGHVLTASIYSKSVLRVAADQISRKYDNVTYFPAYEIITGPQAPENYFEPDRRNVSQIGVEAVMRAFFSACDIVPARIATTAVPQEAYTESATTDVTTIPAARLLSPRHASVAADISAAIVQAECEEAMADKLTE